MSEATVPYEDIVWVCNNLCDLLEYENEVLAQHDRNSVRELSENKAALARLYEQLVAPMADEPTLVNTLEPEQKEELMVLGSRLRDLVEENAMRLKAEMEACQMLMEAVVSAVKSSAANTVTYNQAGTFGAQPGSDHQSLSINRTF